MSSKLLGRALDVLVKNVESIGSGESSDRPRRELKKHRELSGTLGILEAKAFGDSIESIKNTENSCESIKSSR